MLLISCTESRIIWSLNIYNPERFVSLNVTWLLNQLANKLSQVFLIEIEIKSFSMFYIRHINFDVGVMSFNFHFVFQLPSIYTFKFGSLIPSKVGYIQQISLKNSIIEDYSRLNH